MDLADERFAADAVDVGFDPHAAVGLPAAVLHALLHLLEERGRLLLDPRVLLSLGAEEAVLGIALHQRELVAEGAETLALGLADGPEPGGIEMGVAHGGAARRATGGGVREDLGENGGGGGEVRALRDRVAGASECGDQLAGTGGIEREFLEKAERKGEALAKHPGLVVEHCDFAAIEAAGFG